MSLPTNHKHILAFLTPDSVPNVGGVGVWIVSSTGVIAEWNVTAAGRSQPTEQEVLDAGNDLTVVNGQTFSQWLAEHGGDATQTKRRQAREKIDDAIDIKERALLLNANKRINWLTNRVLELQEDLQAIKASSGPVDNIRAAVRASYLATATRDLPGAIQDYKDDIDAGDAD